MHRSTWNIVSARLGTEHLQRRCFWMMTCSLRAAGGVSRPSAVPHAAARLRSRCAADDKLNASWCRAPGRWSTLATDGTAGRETWCPFFPVSPSLVLLLLASRSSRRRAPAAPNLSAHPMDRLKRRAACGGFTPFNSTVRREAGRRSRRGAYCLSLSRAACARGGGVRASPNIAHSRPR